jgi:DNA-binding XRE family transcriptional regulator
MSVVADIRPRSGLGVISMGSADLTDLGVLVKEARRERRMTQAELAAMVGLARQTVVAFEAGCTPEISFSAVVRLMSAVGLDLRAGAYREARRTLDDLVDEEEDTYAPRM